MEELQVSRRKPILNTSQSFILPRNAHGSVLGQHPMTGPTRFLTKHESWKCLSNTSIMPSWVKSCLNWPPGVQTRIPSISSPRGVSLGQPLSHLFLQPKAISWCEASSFTLQSGRAGQHNLVWHRLIHYCSREIAPCHFIRIWIC